MWSNGLYWLACYKDRWWTVVKMVMNILVFLKMWELLE